MIDRPIYGKQKWDAMKKVLGENFSKNKIENYYDFIQLAELGLDGKILENFRQYFNLSINATADLLNVSEPTLYRWANSNKKIEQQHSVKLYELTELFLHGISVFETNKNFFTWLDLPNRSMGGLKPFKVLELPGGTAKVKAIIGRIEHGVFS